MVTEGTPALSREMFKQGMALLSGAFDWDGTPPEQIAGRAESYWVVLRSYPDDVWQEAVRFVIRTRRPTTDRYGRLVKPGFPYAAELAELCDQIAEARQKRLPAPQIVPAPPEIARAALDGIKDRLRHAKGPLAGGLGELTDNGFAPRDRQPDGRDRLKVVK